MIKEVAFTSLLSKYPRTLETISSYCCNGCRKYSLTRMFYSFKSSHWFFLFDRKRQINNNNNKRVSVAERNTPGRQKNTLSLGKVQVSNWIHKEQTLVNGPGSVIKSIIKNAASKRVKPQTRLLHSQNFTGEWWIYTRVRPSKRGIFQNPLSKKAKILTFRAHKQRVPVGLCKRAPQRVVGQGGGRTAEGVGQGGGRTAEGGRTGWWKDRVVG